MNLYKVEDNDRPMYVVAKTWQSAIGTWRSQLIREADGDELDPLDLEPQGIRFVAQGSGDFPEVIYESE